MKNLRQLFFNCVSCKMSALRNISAGWFLVGKKQVLHKKKNNVIMSQIYELCLTNTKLLLLQIARSKMPWRAARRLLSTRGLNQHD